MLRPVALDLFPSQQLDNTQPPPILVDNEEEYRVEKVIDERIKRGRGRGGPLKKEYLVKWVGYYTPTWIEALLLEETEVLDIYLNSKGGSTVTG